MVYDQYSNSEKMASSGVIRKFSSVRNSTDSINMPNPSSLSSKIKKDDVIERIRALCKRNDNITSSPSRVVAA